MAVDVHPSKIAQMQASSSTHKGRFSLTRRECGKYLKFNDEKENSQNAKHANLPRKTKNRVGGFPFVGC